MYCILGGVKPAQDEGKGSKLGKIEMLSVWQADVKVQRGREKQVLEETIITTGTRRNLGQPYGKLTMRTDFMESTWPETARSCNFLPGNGYWECMALA